MGLQKLNRLFSLISAALAISLLLSACQSGSDVDVSGVPPETGNAVPDVKDSGAPPKESALAPSLALPDTPSDEIPSPPSDESGSAGLLWKVEAKEGGGRLYLVGSIHLANEGILPFKHTLTDAFADSDAVVVEVDMEAYQSDLQRQTALAPYVLYLDGTTLKDHLTPEGYAALGAYLQTSGLSYDINTFSTMNIATTIEVLTIAMLQNVGYQSEYGVDMQFLKRAKEMKKPILELESVEAQMKLLAQLPDRTGELLLLEFLQNDQGYKEEVMSMAAAWKVGDIRTFEEEWEKSKKLEVSSLTPEDADLYEDYRKLIMDDRNDAMARRALALLSDGKTYFFLAGALHMVGETGLIKRLQDAGFSVEQVI